LVINFRRSVIVESYGGLKSQDIDKEFHFFAFFWNKCSAAAEMGDRLATIDIGRGLRTQAYLRLRNKHTMVSYTYSELRRKSQTLAQLA